MNPREVDNVILFLASIWKAGLLTGAFAVAFVLIGHELWKRKYPEK